MRLLFFSPLLLCTIFPLSAKAGNMDVASVQTAPARFLSGTVGKKMGLTVTSSKGEDGERSYSLTEIARRTAGMKVAIR